MLTTIEGVYRDGRIELKSLPSNVAEEAKVIVTFIDTDLDLTAHGIDRLQAEILCNNLATFADDWNSPEMSIYDNYDIARVIGSISIENLYNNLRNTFGL